MLLKVGKILLKVGNILLKVGNILVTDVIKQRFARRSVLQVIWCPPTPSPKLA